MHHHQDERIYIVAGEFDFQVGTERFRTGAGESVFLPRKVAHVWATASAKPGTIINVYQPAGRMENFFHEVGRYERRPHIHEALTVDELSGLFGDHGMDLVGPPLVGEWKIERRWASDPECLKARAHSCGLARVFRCADQFGTIRV